MGNTEKYNIDAVVPVSIEADRPEYEDIVNCILEQHEQFGFTHFILTTPVGGWRTVGLPPVEHYIDRAELFKKVAEAVKTHGIVCGWWITLTLKSGPTKDCQRFVKSNGTETIFSTCPLDKNFQKLFYERVKIFTEIAKPKFILLEDDFSVTASTWGYGCFCPLHLAEFSKREGREYTREELVEEFSSGNQELLQRFRILSCDSLVEFANGLREAINTVDPTIPMGFSQLKGSDLDGDCTEPISRALAGSQTLPFSRLHGTTHGTITSTELPSILFNALFERQHIKNNFGFYLEADTYPHTRFFKSGAQMNCLVSAAFSYGFDGMLLYTQQVLDDPNEEKTFGLMYKRERNRFCVVRDIAKNCKIKGIELHYDPIKHPDVRSEWKNCITAYSMPFTTEPSDVIFMDRYNAEDFTDEEITERLSKCVFLDGNAAKVLCRRGFGKYLGVNIGNDVTTGMRVFDIGEREIISDEYCSTKGKHMHSAHMYSPGCGILLDVIVENEKCEILTKEFSFDDQFISNAMTRFKNDLGGTVIVMGLTVEKNYSQCLLNYRRQALFQNCIAEASDSIVFIRNNPYVYVIMNEATDKSEYFGMLTLQNLMDDALKCTVIHLPPMWKNRKYYILDSNAEWVEADYDYVDEGIVLNNSLEHLKPMYLLAK